MANTLAQICYFDPDTYPGVFNSANVLAEEGWEVHILGLDLYGFGGKAFAPGVTTHRLGHGEWRGGGGLRQYIRFLQQVRHLGHRYQWDWLIGHDMMGFAAARLAGICPPERVLFWSQDLAEPSRLTRPKRWLHRLKRHLLKTCPLTVAPSASRARAMERLLHLRRPPLVVYNSPRRDIDVTPTGQWRQKLKLPPETLLGVYAGGFGRDRFVPDLVDSVQHWPSQVHLVLAGYAREDIMAELQALAARPGAEGRIHFVGHLDSPLSLIAEADIGFSFFKMDSNHVNLACRGLASNKIFEYLAMGKAVVTSANEEVDAFFAHYPCGISLPDAAATEIAKSVSDLVSSPQALHSMQRTARETHLAETHFEKRFARVVEALAPSTCSEQLN